MPFWGIACMTRQGSSGVADECRLGACIPGASTSDHRELAELNFHDISMDIMESGHGLPIFASSSFHRIGRHVGPKDSRCSDPYILMFITSTPSALEPLVK